MSRFPTAVAASIFALAACLQAAASQPGEPRAIGVVERGIPLIRNFDPKDYGGRATNWAVVQDHRGVIYVGNESGVLEYDGVRWRMIATPNRTVVRSLAVDPRGRVYVGAVGEIGYLAPDAQGQNAFVSLDSKLAPADREFADVWSTWATKDAVYFAAVNRLIRIRGEEVRTWTPRASFALSFVVHDRFFIREAGHGLLEMKGDQLAPVPGTERFAEEKIYAMLPWNGARRDILLGTRPHGFFVYDGRALTPFGSEEQRQILNQELLYRAVTLPDGSIAAATVQGGVHLIDRDGDLRLRLLKADGLTADSVMALWSEPRRGLWLATTAGVSRIEVPARLSAFDERRGLSGTVMSALRHDGALYVGTTVGLFRLDPNASHDARFEPVAGMRNQTWALLTSGSSLLATNNEGLFEIRGLEAHLVRASERGSVGLLPSKRNPDRLFVGLQNGIALLRRAGEKWIDEGVVAGVTAEVRTLHEDAEGRLWAGTWGEGIFRITFHDGTAPAVERFTLADGLPSLTLVQVYRIGDRIRFATDSGVYAFDESSRRFAADSRFAALFANGPRRIISFPGDPRDERLGVVASDEARSFSRIQIARPDARGVYALESTTVDLDTPSVNLVYPEPNGVTWIGAADGLFRYDSRVASRVAAAPALIRRVAQGQRTVFGGAVSGSGEAPRLEHSRSSLRFDFGAAAYDRGEANRFQYKLEGYDGSWSAWSEETFKEYTNLPPGNYRFRLRARDVDGALGAETSYAFTILAPWYRTPWAWALYALALCAAVWALVRWRVWRLEQEKRVLSERVADRTRDLQEKTVQLERTNVQLESAKAAAEQATRAKSEFLANMSHELRTPLNAILGFAQVLDRSRGLSGDDRGKLAIIHRSGEHLLGLINDVLSISKIEAGKLTLERKPFDLAELIRSAASMMRVRAENAGLELVVGIDAELPRAVLGDEGKLRQVLLNLLGNAVKFTERGRVTLAASWREGRARFAVEDTGQGMSADETATLFEAFVQTESGRRSKEGTGLGLVITRNIIRLMDGEIAVESQRGTGTKFTFDVALPLAEDVQIERRARVTALAAGERSRRVLVADDTAENRLLLVQLLGGVGLEVIEAANGEEAIARWENGGADLILMDTRMPRLDGRAATRRIRELERELGGRVPIVALTASAFDHEREAILNEGADEFLTKPFREERLFEIIEKTTGARFARETEDAAPAGAPLHATIDAARIATLTVAEKRDLHASLESGSTVRAIEVAARIRLRDPHLGDGLSAEIRAFRIDRLLDLLESSSPPRTPGADA